MKFALPRPLLLTLGVAGLALALQAADEPAGYVDFGKFVPSASADQFVEVNLKAGLIKMAAQITKKHEPDVADLLSSVQAVRVNVVGLGDDNRADVAKRIGGIRADLESKGWERIVTAQEKNEDVSVFLKTSSNADTIEGIVVTVVDGDKEAVFVNIVGNVKLDQISTLANKFDIEPLKKIGGTVEKKEAAAESDKK